jgi:predicted aspartyl protease
VKFPYLGRPVRSPLPSLGGAKVRHRPVTSVRVIGPQGDALRDALLDTGAGDTTFPEDVAALIGVDLSQAPQLRIHLAGRGAILCRYAEVTLRLTDNVETYEWEAVVGFVSVPLFTPLLGHAGCLQFFDVTFLGPDHEINLAPNRSFCGRRS